MDKQRLAQIGAAMDWVNKGKDRNASLETNSYNVLHPKETLFISEFRGSNIYSKIVCLSDGIDFDAMLSAKEREEDEKMIEKLKAKYPTEGK